MIFYYPLFVLLATAALLCFFRFRGGTAGPALGIVGGRGEVAYVLVSLRANLESWGLLLSTQTMEESEPKSFNFQPGTLTTDRILTSCALKYVGLVPVFYLKKKKSRHKYLIILKILHHKAIKSAFRQKLCKKLIKDFHFVQKMMRTLTLH